MKILLTGFTPFGEDTKNSSYDSISRLPKYIGPNEVVVEEIDTSFQKAATELFAAIEKHHPDFVVCVGQHAGANSIRIEKVAVNYMDARIPDNDGFQPLDEPVDPAGPAAYFTDLPVEALLEKLKEANIPAAMSLSAGAYVCNFLMYSLLAYCKERGLKGGFVHVPRYPEQFEGDYPSLPLPVITDAIGIICENL